MEVVGKPLKGMDVSSYQGSREGWEIIPSEMGERG